MEVAKRELDFADLEAVDGAAAQLVAEHPDIDLLIACAGLDRAQSLLAFDWRQARDDFTVNSLSNLVLLSHLAPAMARRGGGHVTAIASLAALLGMPYEAPYSASKAALAAIAESARAELEPEGISFTAVFPGFVDTPMFRANAFKKSDPTSQPRRLRLRRRHLLPDRPPRRRRADLHGHPEAAREPPLPGPRARQAAPGEAAAGTPARPDDPARHEPARNRAPKAMSPGPSRAAPCSPASPPPVERY